MLSEVGSNVDFESKNRFRSNNNRLVQRNLPKSRNSNNGSSPISLGMEPVKELEAVLYMVSKIGEEDLFSIGLEMRDSDRIRIKVSMQYCHLPKSRNSNDVSNPISLGMEPVKEFESVLYMVQKIAGKGHIFQSIWEFYF